MNQKSTAFTELKCWQKARSLSKLAYELTKYSKDFILKDQLQRAAISVMNNIAEGYGRSSPKETNRYLDIAIASALEITSMTYLMEDIDFGENEKIHSLRSQSEEVYKMTKGLAIYFRSKTATKIEG